MKASKFLMGSSALALVCGSVAQAAPIVDGPGTIALWHMDAITPNVTSGSFTGDAVLDDDSANPLRDHDLLLGNVPFTDAAQKPTVTAGSLGVFGEALSLDGNDMGFGIVSWKGATDSLDSVYTDFYFQETGQVGAQILVTATSTWEVSMSNNALVFTSWLQAGGANQLFYTLDAPGAWRHVVASHDAAGNQTLSVDGIVVGSASPGGLKLQDKSVTVGNKEGKTRYFTGLLDEVYIGTGAPVPEPASLILLATGGLMAMGRRR